MPAAIPLALIGASVGGSVATGIIGSNAAGHAADTQAAAANHAVDLERQSAQDALNFNKQQYGNSLSLLSPFYNTGVSANSRLAYLMGLNPAKGLPEGVVNPNAPASTNQVPGGGAGFVRQGTGPNGTPGDAVLPAGIGNRGSGDPVINANAFSSLARSPQFSSTGGAAGMLGADGKPMAEPGPGGNPNGPLNLNGAPGQDFGPPPFAGDPNGGINPGNTPGGLGDPSPFGPGGMGDITNAGGVTNATTNQGGTGQVPRVDGGVPAMGPDGTPAPNSFGSLAQGWNKTFQSPTNLTDDPGYNFRLAQGNKAMENSAAARGGLLTGGTAKAIADYNQGSASQEYQNTYNRALQNYDTNYNTFTGDQTNLFNRLMALQNGGQVSANQLSASGLTAAGNAANIGLTSAGQIGQQLNNAGAATASGYVGGANAITGSINNSLNSLSLLALLNKNQGAGAGGIGV